MVEYYNIIGINCSRDNDLWICTITRLLDTEPKEQDNQICYFKKIETIKNLEDIHLLEKAEKCSVMKGSKYDIIRCD